MSFEVINKYLKRKIYINVLLSIEIETRYLLDLKKKEKKKGFQLFNIM